MAKDVIVHGAGIVGLVTAYTAMKAGHNVIIHEPHGLPAMESSHANGGQCSVSNAEVWNSWASVMKGIKWMTKGDAPLLINPAFDWHKYEWLARFMTNIKDYERNTQDTVRMAIRSRDLLERIIYNHSLNVHQETRGVMHVYRSEQALDAARKVNEVYKSTGLPSIQRRTEYDTQALGRIEPIAKDGLLDDVVGGFYYADDWTADVNKFCHELLRVMINQGVEIHKTVADNKSAVHIYCTGVARYSGPYCPVRGTTDFVREYMIYPVKGYSITVDNIWDNPLRPSDRPVMTAPSVSILDSENKIVSSSYDDRFRVAGTAEFNGWNKDIRMDRIEPLIQWVRTNFPRVPLAKITPWAGLRPMRPNMLPIVEKRKDGNIVNLGHGHLGWTLSAVTAEQAVALI